MLDASIIICAHNPRFHYLERVLAALRIQSLPYEQWELLLVDNASEAVSQLKSLATSSRDSVVMNAYESARGYLLARQGDLSAAADELSTDPHSPLVLQQLASVHEKLGNTITAQATRTRLKFQRAPTVEWFLVTHPNTGAAD